MRIEESVRAFLTTTLATMSLIVHVEMSFVAAAFCISALRPLRLTPKPVRETPDTGGMLIS